MSVQFHHFHMQKLLAIAQPDQNGLLRISQLNQAQLRGKESLRAVPEPQLSSPSIFLQSPTPRVVPLEPPKPTGSAPSKLCGGCRLHNKTISSSAGGELGSSFSESLLGPGKGRLGSSCRNHLLLRITNTASCVTFNPGPPQILLPPPITLSSICAQPTLPVEPPTSQDSR